MPRTRPAALLLAATLTLAAGCGGDGGAGPGGPGTAAAPPPASAGSPAPGSSSPGTPSPGGTAAPSPSGASPGGPSAPAPGASAPAPAPKAPRPTTAPSKVVSAFAACMRGHGVDVPDNVRTWTPPPGSDTETQAALLACMQSLPR